VPDTYPLPATVADAEPVAIHDCEGVPVIGAVDECGNKPAGEAVADPVEVEEAVLALLGKLELELEVVAIAVADAELLDVLVLQTCARFVCTWQLRKNHRE
jgi:hypothetical protein